MDELKTTRNKGCPCRKDCGNRHAGCHAECEDYKKWRSDLDAKNAAIKKEKERYNTLSESAKKKMWRKQRYKNQQPFIRTNFDK